MGTGRTLRDAACVVAEVSPGARATQTTPREPRVHSAEYWTEGGGGVARGPRAVCLIASPHKRAFKAFPTPPPSLTR